MVLLFTLGLVACSQAIPITQTVSVEPVVTIEIANAPIVNTASSIPIEEVVSPTSFPTLTPLPSDTPDACAGATYPGARQKFTLEQIIPCLDTIDKVSSFMANNVQYDVEYDVRERGGNEYAPPSVIYERGIDDADGYAILECYLLEKNGWDAYVIGLSIESRKGSNVCGVNTEDGILAMAGTKQTAGPFESFTDLAAFFIQIDWMQSGGTLRTLKASQVTQITTDNTSPSVLELPWVSQKY
jgi:hypothetical protein